MSIHSYLLLQNLINHLPRRENWWDLRDSDDSGQDYLVHLPFWLSSWVNRSLCLIQLQYLFCPYIFDLSDFFKPLVAAAAAADWGGLKQYLYMSWLTVFVFVERRTQKVNLSSKYFPPLWAISGKWLWWSYQPRLCCQPLHSAWPSSFLCLCHKPYSYPCLLTPSHTPHPICIRKSSGLYFSDGNLQSDHFLPPPWLPL